jgi:hypothetical protein
MAEVVPEIEFAFGLLTSLESRLQVLRLAGPVAGHERELRRLVSATRNLSERIHDVEKALGVRYG